MIRYKNKSKSEIKIDYPIYLCEIYNLKNHMSKEEFDYLIFYLKNNDFEKLDEKLEAYKNYNLGRSKFFLSIKLKPTVTPIMIKVSNSSYGPIIPLKKSRFKLPTLNYLTDYGVNYIIMERKGGNEATDDPIKGRLKNEDKLVIGCIVRNVIKNFRSLIEDCNNRYSCKIYNDDILITYLSIYASYKWGFLERWKGEK